MLLTQMNPGLSSEPHFDHVHTPAVLPLQPGAFPPSPLHMPPSKRPKLSLQTSQISASYTPSASTAGKRIDNMSAATPTTANTFNNTFDLSIRPSPNSATASPASYFPRTKSIASPLRRSQPYSFSLPLGVKSILKNSRLGRDYGHVSLATSASPRTGRRVFFPPAKKVSFHSIDETIVTHTYTARHHDLSLSENEEMSSAGEVDEAPEQDVVVAVVVSENGLGAPERPVADRSRSPERESRGRRRRQRATSGVRKNKKRRRWEWTLENPEEVDSVDGGRREQEQAVISPVIPEQPAVTPEQPAVIQEQPAVIQEQPAVIQEQPAVIQEQPAVSPILPEQAAAPQEQTAVIPAHQEQTSAPQEQTSTPQPQPSIIPMHQEPAQTDAIHQEAKETSTSTSTPISIPIPTPTPTLTLPPIPIPIPMADSDSDSDNATTTAAAGTVTVHDTEKSITITIAGS